jgi:adenylate cyclase
VSDAWLQPARGERIILHGNCGIGRAPENDVVIDVPKASRDHAAIHAQGGGEYWLVDLGSANGTYLNGRRVFHPTRLNDGDRISLAGFDYTFRQLMESVASAKLGGRSAVTVMDYVQHPTWLVITDIQGFVKMSQAVPAEKLAVVVGTWFQAGKEIVERHGGRVAKYLGDGFLAFWRPSDGDAKEVVETLRGLNGLRGPDAVKFRIVIHHGLVTFGGGAVSTEELVIGPEVNFTFRLEKLAGQLGVADCVSSAAQPALAPLITLAPVSGGHELKGFEGKHRCFSIEWPVQ